MLIEDTPETMIRSDLWPTMSMGELSHQQDLMITKLSAVMTLIGPNSSPSITNMYNALQAGMNQLNSIIDLRSQKEK